MIDAERKKERERENGWCAAPRENGKESEKEMESDQSLSTIEPQKKKTQNNVKKNPMRLIAKTHKTTSQKVSQHMRFRESTTCTGTERESAVTHAQARSPRMRHVARHDGHTLGVDGTEVRVLKETDKIRLCRLLQRQHCCTLEAQISLELLGNLTH